MKSFLFIGRRAFWKVINYYLIPLVPKGGLASLSRVLPALACDLYFPRVVKSVFQAQRALQIHHMVLNGTIWRGDRYSSQFKNNCFTEMCSGSVEGSYLRLIDLCIAEL